MGLGVSLLLGDQEEPLRDLSRALPPLAKQGRERSLYPLQILQGVVFDQWERKDIWTIEELNLI